MRMSEDERKREERHAWGFDENWEHWNDAIWTIGPGAAAAWSGATAAAQIPVPHPGAKAALVLAGAIGGAWNYYDSPWSTVISEIGSKRTEKAIDFFIARETKKIDRDHTIGISFDAGSFGRGIATTDIRYPLSDGIFNTGQVRGLFQSQSPSLEGEKLLLQAIDQGSIATRFLNIAQGGTPRSPGYNTGKTFSLHIGSTNYNASNAFDGSMSSNTNQSGKIDQNNLTVNGLVYGDNGEGGITKLFDFEKLTTSGQSEQKKNPDLIEITGCLYNNGGKIYYLPDGTISFSLDATRYKVLNWIDYTGIYQSYDAHQRNERLDYNGR